MKVKTNETVERDVTEIQIYLHVRDEFSASLHDVNGAQVCLQEDGYVPALMPGQHHGDYVILNIDIESGLVTNWKRPKRSDIEDFIAKCQSNKP